MGIIGLIQSSTQAQVRAVWDPSPDAKTVGYKLYYGEQENDYTECIDVGNQTSYVIEGLNEGKVYYASVSAYDPSGVESELSNKVEWLVARTYTLTVEITGDAMGGKVDKSFETAKEGTVITLTATPTEGYQVKAWYGADAQPAPLSNTNTVTMTGDKDVTVEFEEIPATGLNPPTNNDQATKELSNVPTPDTSPDEDTPVVEASEPSLSEELETALEDNGMEPSDMVPGSGCFMATAAAGTEQEVHLAGIRDFRDDFLMTNRPGQWFVAMYYRHSPSVARYLAGHENARTLVRELLWPVVWAFECPLFMVNGVILIFCLTAGPIIRRWLTKVTIIKSDFSRCYDNVAYN